MKNSLLDSQTRWATSFSQSVNMLSAWPKNYSELSHRINAQVAIGG